MLSRRRLRSTLSLLVILAAGGCTAGASGGNSGISPQDSLAVRASADKWVSTTLSRDFDAWGTTVTPDVVLYPPNSKPVVGREGAVAYVKGYPTIEKFAIAIDELTGRGDMAYDRGTFTLSVKLPDGSTMADTGSFFSVFRRQADGSWAHSRVAWTTHKPVPAPPTPARRGR